MKKSTHNQDYRNSEITLKLNLAVFENDLKSQYQKVIQNTILIISPLNQELFLNNIFQIESRANNQHLILAPPPGTETFTVSHNFYRMTKGSVIQWSLQISGQQAFKLELLRLGLVTFGMNNSLFWWAVLRILGWFAASLAIINQTAVSTQFTLLQSVTTTKVFIYIANVFGGKNQSTQRATD